MSDYNPIAPKYCPKGEEPPSPEKKWLDAVEEQVKEAQERGDFDNLAGRGKPLNLQGNPWAGDWEMAYKAMSNAGYVPEWIERDKEIRQAIHEAQRMLERHLTWDAEAVAELGRLPDKKRGLKRQVILNARASVVRRYREKVALINSKIATFNLICPVPSMHRFKLRPDEEITQFESRLVALPD